MFRNYLKTALGNLLQNKLYAFINVAGLTLGLACVMLIMLYVNDEVSYDRFHSNVTNIYRIDKRSTKDNGDEHYNSYTGYFPGPRFAARIPEIRSFVRYQPGKIDIKTEKDVQSQDICYVEANFFSVFSFPLISGNAGSVLREPNSVVLTREMATKYFGKQDAVGQTMMLSRKGSFMPFVVTGIAEDCPQNSSIKFNVLLPMRVSAEDEANNGNWFNSFLSTFVVLTPNANVDVVQKKMDKVFEADASVSISEMRSRYGIQNIGISYTLEPLSAIHLGNEVQAQDEVLADKSSPTFSYIMSAIAVFILLIACINFVNLTLARSVKRAKEIGIRKVIGGTRQQLMFQFLSESFILCLFAFSFAIVVVLLALPIFNQLSNKALSLSYLLNAKLVLGYVGIFLLTGVLSGLYPAMILSNFTPVQTLYSHFNLAGKGQLQKALVVLQFALASFLIVGTLAISLQFNYLTTFDLGYNDSNLVTVAKSNMTHLEAALFRQSLAKNPNILSVASASASNNTVQVNGDKQVNAVIETIDESYLPLLEVPVIEGRNFSTDFPSDSAHSILVNEAFARQANLKQAVGQQVTSFENNKTYTIVGVVKDYHYRPLTVAIEPQVFTMNPARNYSTTYIRIKPHTETASLQSIAVSFRELFPMSPFAYNFKSDQNETSYTAEAKSKQILSLSAILTIFISCIGLFGLSILSAEKRTKEIGVRKVLGASVAGIVTILSTDFLKLIIISLVISIPLAWFATHQWLEHYPYRIELSWWVFALAAVLVILVALVTISFQALRAAIANPVRSLRME